MTSTTTALAWGAGVTTARTTADAVAELSAAVGGRVRVNVPMGELTTLRVGGPCDVLIEPSTDAELRAAVQWCARTNTPIKVIGNGSNLLAGDKGIRGAVIKLVPNFRETKWFEGGVIAGAGVKLGKLIHDAAEHQLSGLESVLGVPGTVGGALIMNAGTDVGSIGELVEELYALDRHHHELFTRPSKEMKYGYRSCALRGSDVVITGVKLRLVPGDKEEIYSKMRRLGEKRASRQPLGSPTAGSVFKNPEGGPAAGKLLDLAGAKGKRIGGAYVSRKHANWVINGGGATAADLRTLMDWMREVVQTVHGVDLEPEIELCGEW